MGEQSVREFLQLGTIGHAHVLAAAQKSFAKAEKGAMDQWVDIGSKLLCMAWLESPLNAMLATEMVKLSGSLPSLNRLFTPQGLRLLSIAATKSQGGDDPLVPKLFSLGDYTAMSHRLEQAAGAGNVLAAARQAMIFQGVLSRWEWLEDFLERFVTPVEPEIASFFLADVWLANGKYEQAAVAYAQLMDRFGLPGLGFKRAVAHAGAGETEESLSLLGEVVSGFPMHSSALLFMDGLAFPGGGGSLSSKCVISIYSYNKSEELARTLESVLASDLSDAVGDITVRVLINGSEDDSLTVAEGFRERFGSRMDIVSLPVNVGAPAARNWLIDAARKDNARWIVFLDDDVLLPVDWLSRLASGAAEFPEAGVWGCRVGDNVSSSITQHGDAFILSAQDAAQQGRQVALYAPSAECMFPDMLNYRRYSSTVTGCCHLFRMETLQGHGGFDLAFSPSQYDDFDSDIRLLLNEKPAVYLGDVGITHLRVSPRIAEPSVAAQRQSDNHQSLFEGRYAPQLEAILKIQSAFVKGDLERKCLRLQDAGFLPASL